MRRVYWILAGMALYDVYAAARRFLRRIGTAVGILRS